MKPISEMTPLEIREAVATRVMGWTKKPLVPDGPVWWFGPDGAPEFDAWCADDYMPAYESKIGPAFEVVARVREKGYHFEMEYGPGENSVCYATFSMYGSRGHARLLPVPLAIAAAALEATGSAK